ncbi:MAG: NHLP bacteriocin export ABC transporter permease/ATPase subunit [Planctomycetota bacterium]|nr:MAG: NHLP bacteriocin export ABC transporter permease/ATPase subunit [Planctomycetota bacterium]REJ91405.1 MAG: NHLP bacteriocin export ABC transporter permease/ATPase subunit [Planctomycetota bacterium]REK18475.1 MAG: NHLP bacteriocin export ABC transporter permease/ATPase subunit [Planctomycetota bacterium]REK39464.1 MAG: NHLP bacteriocin export ABC transporter permease/ATPase subunit [Planctomycetota bacterium]
MASTSDYPTKLHDVRGNITLLLSDPDVAWKVHAGSVAVFAVRTTNGVPTGARRYLFSCNEGDLLFGCRPDAREGGFAFLVVGLEDSQLAECPLRTLAASSEYAVDEVRTRAETWIRRLGDLLGDAERAVHAERASTAGPIPLAAEQHIKAPADTVLWLEVLEGQLTVAGIEAPRIDAGSPSLPVSDAVRLTATRESKVVFRSGDTFSSPSEMLEGLDRLHRLCMRRFAELEQREVEEDRQRLEQRTHLQATDTTEAMDELSEVLDRRPAGVEEADDLMGALKAIGKRLGITFRRPAPGIDLGRLDDPLQAIARASRVRARFVLLRGKWWHEDAGPILGVLEEEERAVALLPERGGYIMFDATDGSKRRVNEQVDGRLLRSATTFVRPLPDRANSLVTLGRFALQPIRTDILIVVFLALAVTLLGMLVPISTRLVIDQAIPDANLTLLYQLAAGLLAMAFGQAALTFSQNNVLLRADVGTTAGLQAAVIDRLMRLPARFFRNYSSGDLQNRAMMVTEISQNVGHAAIGGILGGGLATLNLVLCFFYSPYLAIIALVSALVIAAYTAGLSMTIRNTARRLGISQGRLFGFQVQLISGVSKLHVAGAEQRAFNHWARQQAKQLRMISTIQRIEQWGEVVNTALQSASTIVLYFFAATMLAAVASPGGGLRPAAPTLLTIGTFLAFYAAFQALIGGMTGFSETFVEVMDSLAKRKMITPLLEAKPENDDTKVDPGPLQGAISVNEVSFRYRNDGPQILSGVSCHANPGEFIALVGPSGCGKSTLLRLILGFETPRSGSVCFDGQDLAGLDGTAVRRQIGVVLQSGVVSSGSIFDNIAGAARISLEEAWEAAEAAGLSDDIHQMPMGMHTYLSEGGGTLSGGQRQRLLIARALSTKPKILIFDEATSALDNRTQQIVSESIDRLRVTRLVVAHRLSTIRDANRIYVLEAGKLTQSGSFAELAAAEGLFRRMIARQLA